MSEFPAVGFERGLALGVRALPVLPHVRTYSGHHEPAPAAAIVGRFQALKTLNHPALCAYLDIVRGRHERLFTIAEHFGRSLSSELRQPLNASTIARYTLTILQALTYLNGEGIVARNLQPASILFDAEGHLRLADYGLSHLTHNSTGARLVPFRFEPPAYMAPEVVLGGPQAHATPQGDVWALGLIILEMARGRTTDVPRETVAQSALERSVGYLARDPAAVKALIGEAAAECPVLNGPLLDLVTQCLTVDPALRPVPRDLLLHPFLLAIQGSEPLWNEPALPGEELILPVARPISVTTSSASSVLGSNYPATPKATEILDFSGVRGVDPLSALPLCDVSHLWQLMTPNLDAEYVRQRPTSGTVSARAPVLGMPRLLRVDTETSGVAEQEMCAVDFDDEVAVIQLDALRDRVRAALHDPPVRASGRRKSRGNSTPRDDDLSGFDVVSRDEMLEAAASTGPPVPLPPVAIRERDVNYQCARIKLFRELLRDYQLGGSKDNEDIVAEAMVDIPPLLRGEVWAALLRVDSEAARVIYEGIDKVSEGVSDRQIEVDIPRCHQYNPMLASAEGHRRFHRILKTWICVNKQLVYWQGLDSLSAPFVALLFNAEHAAYMSLQKLVEKYLKNFFLPDNSAVMQEHLVVFKQLVAYHDPELAWHLETLGFQPEFYAIPWFLTIFAHIFPLTTIYILWDRLLVSPPSYPLFIATALLRHLRAPLLEMDFNSCILVFSDLPSVDMSQCIAQATALLEASPPSFRTRVHAPGAPAAEPPRERWWEAPLTLEQLRAEPTPRVEWEDLVHLRPHVLLDVRPAAEFAAQHLPNSVSVPWPASTPEEVVAAVAGHPGACVVIVGRRGDNVADVVRVLVEAKRPYVSILNGGIDVIKTHARRDLVGH